MDIANAAVLRLWPAAAACSAQEATPVAQHHLAAMHVWAVLHDRCAMCILTRSKYLLQCCIDVSLLCWIKAYQSLCQHSSRWLHSTQHTPITSTLSRQQMTKQAYQLTSSCQLLAAAATTGCTEVVHKPDCSCSSIKQTSSVIAFWYCIYHNSRYLPL
jgi:hypothetical protein